MADFEINKGVGREVEFKGLRAQYLFIFAAGLLAVFVMFVIMYMAGVINCLFTFGRSNRRAGSSGLHNAIRSKASVWTSSLTPCLEFANTALSQTAFIPDFVRRPAGR